MLALYIDGLSTTARLEYCNSELNLSDLISTNVARLVRYSLVKAINRKKTSGASSVEFFAAFQRVEMAENVKK